MFKPSWQSEWEITKKKEEPREIFRREAEKFNVSLTKFLASKENSKHVPSLYKYLIIALQN